MNRPKLLDLFCGAGGAAVGYHRAGFDVIGVDIEPQPNYPFEFIEDDAVDVLRRLLTGDLPGVGPFAAIHASPPCQDYSTTRSLHTTAYPRLIRPVRDLLIGSGYPYAIENVEGARADMRNPVRLCGSSFGLGVRRHRLFELSWPVAMVPPCAHYLQPEPVDVTGTGGPSDREPGGNGGIHRKPRNLTHAREAMGIDWMSRRELSEAIPPAYATWIGAQLVAHINAEKVA